MPRKYAQANIIRALKATGGVYKDAADVLGCSPETIRTYVRKFPAIETALEQIEAENLDFAESELLAAVKGGKAWAIKYYLDNKGEVRGYGKKREADGGGRPAPQVTQNVVVALPDNRRDAQIVSVENVPKAKALPAPEEDDEGDEE